MALLFSEKITHTIFIGGIIMNENIELLNFIYQNSQMGVITIEMLIEIVQDDKFKSHLESQYNEYKAINEEAKSILNANGYDEKGINFLEKIKTYFMLNLQTLTDKSASHIAEMLMTGSNMGIINAIKNLKKYSNAQFEILELISRLLYLEENNVQELKQFL